MSFSKEQNTMMVPAEKRRELKCTKCRNHGFIHPLKGHARLCPFVSCPCWECELVTHRNQIKALKSKIAKYQNKVGPPCVDTGGSGERPPPGGMPGASPAGGVAHQPATSGALFSWSSPEIPIKPAGRGEHAAPGMDGRQMLQAGPPVRFPWWGSLEYPGSYSPYPSFPLSPMPPRPYGTYNVRPPLVLYFQPGAVPCPRPPPESGLPAGILGSWMPYDRQHPQPHQPSREEEDALGQCTPDSPVNYSSPSKREI